MYSHCTATAQSLVVTSQRAVLSQKHWPGTSHVGDVFTCVDAVERPTQIASDESGPILALPLASLSPPRFTSGRGLWLVIELAQADELLLASLSPHDSARTLCLLRSEEKKILTRCVEFTADALACRPAISSMHFYPCVRCTVPVCWHWCMFHFAYRQLHVSCMV